MNRRGVTLVEVTLALAVLAIALLPILVMNSTARAEVKDAESFAALLVQADEVAPPPAIGDWPFAERTVRVGEGPRQLVVRRFSVDPAASCAPQVGESR